MFFLKVLKYIFLMRNTIIVEYTLLLFHQALFQICKVV